MNKDIMKALYEPFEVKERRGVGNQTFKYVPNEDISDRMNKVFQGNWSTKVVSSEIIEDQVLMCVRVCATAIEPDGRTLEFCQEGYASHPVTRYTSGTNQGKSMDIGNSYKSAMSKAIKTAVAKWGVGLYLELNEEADAPVFTAPAMTKVSSSEPSFSAAPKKMSGPPMDIPVETKAATSAPAPKSFMSGPPMDTYQGNAAPDERYQQSTKPRMQPPIFTVENNEPIKKASTGFDLPSGGGIERITDVQRVAIETIMSMHGIGFEELLSKALHRSEKLPRSLDDIAYLDAVTIIQYGNELRQV